MYRLDDGNFQLNVVVDDKFYFILTDEDFSKNMGVNYASGVKPTYEEYTDMIVKGRSEEEEEVIDKYLNMNMIFEVVTSEKCCGTMVNRSRGLDGRDIGNLYNNSFFDTREYKIYFIYGTQDKYIVNIFT